MLFLLIFLPVIGGLVSWLFSIFASRQLGDMLSNGKTSLPRTSRNLSFFVKFRFKFLQHGSSWLAVGTLVILLAILIYYWQLCLASFHNENSLWSEQLDWVWIPFLGIKFHLLLDGFSILFVTLSVLIALFTIFYSFQAKVENAGLFYFFILFSVSAVIGFFVAADLFLFFLFWEMVTIPIYFLVVLWGRPESNPQLRANGALRLVIFSQLSGLLMLISIISLALINFSLSGRWTFDYTVLINTPISSYVEFLLMLGFLFAFMVKMSIVPFHGWFIDAHIESSVMGSIVLSSFLTSGSIYGLLRFAISIFPNASVTVAPFVVTVALLSLYYSSFLIFTQNDIKKLIAYLHISLVSFLMAMIYIGGLLTYQAIVIQTISISILVVGLFTVSGPLIEIYNSRDINKFIHINHIDRYLPAFGLIFSLNILGIPGTANFVGNLMLLLGGFGKYSFVSILLFIGLLLASVAFLIRMQPLFYGLFSSKKSEVHNMVKSLPKQELWLLTSLITILVAIGLFPQFILNTAYLVIEQVENLWKSGQVIVFREGA